MVRCELTGFIRDAREVISDPEAEHQVIAEVYSRVRGPAYKFLESYYHQQDLAHDPFKVAQHHTVTVQIDSILKLRTSMVWSASICTILHGLGNVTSDPVSMS